MRIRTAAVFAFLILLVWATLAQKGRVEAVEIGRHNTDLLPGGKEADGIVGDFVLRNDKIHALISGAQPLRRANMTTEYGAVLQGVLYDLDLRGAANDQLTAFRPGGESGELSWVRVANDGSDGGGLIEAVRTAAKGEGLYTRHEYRLESGWQHVLVISTFRNESSTPTKATPLPVWKGLSTEWDVAGVHIGDSIDPFDKRAYAYAPAPGAPPLEKEIELKPGEERVFRIVLATASSPLAAYGVIAALSKPAGDVSGAVRDPSGAGAIHGSLLVTVDGKPIPYYPDAGGTIAFQIPAGDYKAVFEDMGRDTVERTFSVRPKQNTRVDIAAPAASQASVKIVDESGAASPGRVQFIGAEGTPTPDLGTVHRAHGTDHQYHTHDGSFVQQLPPGKYLVRVTHGPEFNLYEQTITVAKGQTASVTATLRRTVDTTGWISTDYHAHSTPSGDNYCNTNDRIINFAAEHLEFVPTTEHNRIYDWAPHIDRLGLASRMKTIQGMELTGSGQHFNAFPLTRDPFAQNGGAPLWNYDPRINAIVLRNWGTPTLKESGSRFDTEANARNKVPYFGGGADRWVQANHPIVGNVFFDRDSDGVADGGFVGFEEMIDGAEVWSTEILNLNPRYQFEGVAGGGNKGQQNRTFGWLQMLNQNRRVWCVAVSDAHRIFGGGVGGWRTYVPSSTDDPARIDAEEIIRNSKAGRMVITNGPFLQVTTGDGLPVGSTVVAAGHVDLKISKCRRRTGWTSIESRCWSVVASRPSTTSRGKRAPVCSQQERCDSSKPSV
jgi:hypothetical protein